MQTHIPLLSEVLLDADSDPLQSRLPLVWRLVQLALKPLDVLQEEEGAEEDTFRDPLQNSSGCQWNHYWGPHRQQLGDGIRLGAANAAVARPHDAPPAAGDGVRLLAAVRPCRHHPPVVARPRGQGLVCKEVPLAEAGNADGGLQDDLRGERGAELDVTF